MSRVEDILSGTYTGEPLSRVEKLLIEKEGSGNGSSNQPIQLDDNLYDQIMDKFEEDNELTHEDIADMWKDPRPLIIDYWHGNDSTKYTAENGDVISLEAGTYTFKVRQGVDRPNVNIVNNNTSYEAMSFTWEVVPRIMGRPAPEYSVTSTYNVFDGLDIEITLPATSTNRASKIVFKGVNHS